MAGKSYKQLYEETKFMLDKYQDEIVPKLREQAQPLTEEELLALKVVAHGCNTNPKLTMTSSYEGMRYSKALIKVYNLIKRLS